MERLSVLEKQRQENQRSHRPAKEELLLSYTDYVGQRRREAAKTLCQLETESFYEETCLYLERRTSCRNPNAGRRRSSPETREHVRRINGLRHRKSALMAMDPDVFYKAHAEMLLADVSDEQSGRLIDVPYLHRARKLIAASLDAGIPVYLVGHLGSGKTQLAVEAAQDSMRRRFLMQKLSEALLSYRNGHPDSGREEELAWFSGICTAVREKAAKEAFHPYFISGSHNLTAEDMFTEKTLKLTQAGSRSTDEDQLGKLTENFLAFCREQEGRLKSLAPEKQLELLLAGWKTYSDLYISKNTGFGTVVEKVEKEVLKALREGRPVIIDEINTIAMSNLIALNDILQHHAGQEAYITGVGTVKIAEGFCLIGTGNLSTGTVSYEGTNVLNPAFQSRFTTIAYNYVPQSTEGTLAEQKDPAKNELFRMVIEHLCDAEGCLSLPEPEVTIDALWRLAQLARMSQDIFEGHGKSLDGAGDVPVLTESVLSIRNLIHVLDLWNLGEEMDLSMALWNGFLGSVTNSDDRNLLLSLAVRYGFFQPQDGWKVESRARGEAGQRYEDIRTQETICDPQPLVDLSREDTVRLIFGKGPSRKSLPDALKSQILVDENMDVSVADFMEADSTVRELQHSAEVLEQISRQDTDQSNR